MAVYREGFKGVSTIEKMQVRIFPDACDYGVPTRKDDTIWNLHKQLAEWYGDQSTKKVERYDGGGSSKIEITLIDEWAVSDERKTVKEATEVYVLEYTSCTTGRCKGYDGYITITKK